METVTLGMTDLNVSRIAFGAWELGGEWGSFDENAAIATIRDARERGITLFDTRGPLVLVNEETLLMNAVAAGTFTDGDRRLLWDMVRQAVGSDAVEPFAFTTRDGTSLMGSVKPVYEHGAMIAALVKFHAPREPTARVARPSFGWDSLTPSEHGLIRVIADGLTNREAAARLYVSHHTIDSHLRHIFRKLGINSRVQLARIAASMSAPPTAESA